MAILSPEAILNREAPAVRPAPVGLTRREDEVLQLLTDRLTNQEISEQLHISIRTAEHHVGCVIAKLGVTNRRQAAMIAKSVPEHRPPTP